MANPDPQECAVGSIDDLVQLATQGKNPETRQVLLRAYAFAAEKHAGQTRTSGEPYIQHPLAVAGSLACLKLDAETLAAALLHDVMEDCGVTREEMTTLFGPKITELVDAVTKLSKREALPMREGAEEDPRLEEARERDMKRRKSHEAESLRKMFLGLAKDVRVVLIKLADRLHNMQTLDALRPEKRRRIARETLDVFAPLANRLGMWDWKQQLEELGFKYAEEQTYKDIQARLEEDASARKASIDRLLNKLRSALEERDINNVEVYGRAKSIYSIWRKMERKHATFDQIWDLRAMRVIIDDHELDEAIHAANADDLSAEAREALQRDVQKRRDQAEMQCYNVLFVVHKLWNPIAQEFNDYISRPKGNHYQSLHTAVHTESGEAVEVQIRTRGMHRAAEYGVAAHWLYKESGGITAEYQRHIDAYRADLEALNTAEDDAEIFVSAAVAESKSDDSIYCFTPLGKLIELPRGATVLDFAFHVHTNLGYRCRGGIINGKQRGITQVLENDDQVQILEHPSPQPSRDWLYHSEKYVKTESAKAKIKLYFKRLDRPQNIVGGREAIEREISKLTVGTDFGMADVLKLYAVEPNNQDRADDFLANVGWGAISLQGISSRIMVEIQRRDRKREEAAQGSITVAERMRKTLLREHRQRQQPRKRGFVLEGTLDIYGEPAQCCNPLPGEDVIGFVTNGIGIKVHRRSCSNMANADPNRIYRMEYVGDNNEVFPVELMVRAVDQPGLLQECSGVLADGDVNILDVGIVNRNARTGETNLWFKVELRNATEVVGIISRLERVRNVIDARRVANVKPVRARRSASA